MEEKAYLFKQVRKLTGKENWLINSILVLPNTTGYGLAVSLRTMNCEYVKILDIKDKLHMIYLFNL